MNWTLVLFIFLLAALLALVLMYLRLRRMPAQTSDSNEGNFRSIVELANDSILVIDIADGKILQANPGATQLLGYSTDQFQGKRFFELVQTKDVERSSMLVADVWEKKGLIFSDLPFVTAFGELLPVECSACVAPFAGRPAIVIYARDIRERIRLEREIQLQAAEIEQKNRDITDSINYARKIQDSISPTEEELSQILEQHFVFYRPKDIVSGDFYWGANFSTTPPGASEPMELNVVAAVDCTGHGVPGAFMSIIGHTLLNQTRADRDVNSVAEGLSYLHRELLKTLKERHKEQALRDGMDISMCAINRKAGWIEFAGANHPLYMIRDGELTIIKGDKQPVGRFVRETRPFTAHKIDIRTGDLFYIFSDGIADQFGGLKGKKFKNTRLQQVLLENAHKDMKGQFDAIDKAINDWMQHELPGGGLPAQTDDMLLIGFRI